MMKDQKLLLYLSALIILLCCSACEKNPEQPVLYTISPEESAFGGNMRETVLLTESETESETLPEFQTVKPWLDYGGLRNDELPETEKIQIGGNIEVIECMVGSIEQRFYEKQAISEKTVQKISEIWENFSGEELNLKNLTCIMSDKKMSFTAVPEEEYADIQNLEYHSDQMILNYHTETQELLLKQKDFPENPDSVYQQTEPLWVIPMKTVYDEAAQGYTFAPDTEVIHAGTTDTVLLDGEEISLAELQNTARNFLYSQENKNSLFYTSDYQISDGKLEIQNFSDGNQAVIFSFAFISRDMPIVSESGTDSGTFKRIQGTNIEIGIFKKNQIGYVKSNYFINPPSQIQYTDYRANMQGITLLDVQKAFQLADDFLEQERMLQSGKLEYASEAIFDSRDIFQGYVLTPVWHLIFKPTEQELSQGYYTMILDIDAVTGEVLQWYSTEPEQSGEKCWTAHPEITE